MPQPPVALATPLVTAPHPPVVLTVGEYASLARWPGLIHSISPASGQAGTEVLITGRFYPVGTIITVDLGGAAATILDVSDSEIRVTAPDGQFLASWLAHLDLSSAVYGLHTLT